MSEDDRVDVPPAEVDREFSRANQMLDDASAARDVDISKATIVNRLYYCCFHAAQAVLYARGFDPSSHGGVQMLLGRELIQSGDLDRRFGRFLHDMETYRRRVDYGSGTVERATDDLIAETRAFLDAMDDCLDREG